MFGSTLGMFSDGFGMVSRKSSEEVNKNDIFKKCLGVFFLSRAAQNNYFGAVPGQKISGNLKIIF